jgi:hypothetical protein
MKIRFWGLIAFDIAAMCVIARTKGFPLTMILVVSLFVTNILLAFVFRLYPSPRTDSLGRIVTLLRWARWIDYIPLLGGTVCILIGMFEFMWKPCVIGAVAIATGLWRIWARGRVQEALRNRS